MLPIPASSLFAPHANWPCYQDCRYPRRPALAVSAPDSKIGRSRLRTNRWPADNGITYCIQRILDRLDRLTGRILLIAAENDFTPLKEKRELAKATTSRYRGGAGSRHGTPFDSVEATNTSLLALLTDQPMPPKANG